MQHDAELDEPVDLDLQHEAEVGHGPSHDVHNLLVDLASHPQVLTPDVGVAHGAEHVLGADEPPATVRELRAHRVGHGGHRGGGLHRRTSTGRRRLRPIAATRSRASRR